VGWGFFCPVLLVLLAEAQAEPHWYVLALIGSYLYPALMIWLTPRAASPIRLVMAGHGLESVMLAVFAEVACTDPVLVLVSLSVVVINAGVTRGRQGAAAVFLTYVATLTMVNGRLRAVEAIDPSSLVHVMLGLFLLGYVSVVAHQVYTLMVRDALSRRALIRQKDQLDALHRHLVETISNPFISDEAVLEIIGPRLTEEQAQKYAERIRNRQRWEAIGRRTRSLSHDANNLLMPMMMMGDLLEDKLIGDAEAINYLSDLGTAAMQLQALHRQINPAPTDPKPSDAVAVLQHVVNEVLSLLRATAPGGVTVALDNDLDDLVYVPIDASSLHRCILNLCTNAIQAMKETGLLTLRMRVASTAEHTRLFNHQGHTGVTVCVEDTGDGMAPEVAERVFEPYFTTRTDDGGTGLGLSTTHALLTDAGGTISLDSTPGAGTTFTLTLPALP
jgi:signal transduction histidine kinase